MRASASSASASTSRTISGSSSDSLYVRAYLNSVRIAATSTVLTLLIGFPIAYGMARATDRWRPVLLMMVVLPFWTSFLIRVYAWIGILKNDGLLNAAPAVARASSRRRS